MGAGHHQGGGDSPAPDPLDKFLAHAITPDPDPDHEWFPVEVAEAVFKWETHRRRLWSRDNPEGRAALARFLDHPALKAGNFWGRFLDLQKDTLPEPVRATHVGMFLVDVMTYATARGRKPRRPTKTPGERRGQWEKIARKAAELRELVAEDSPLGGLCIIKDRAWISFTEALGELETEARTLHETGLLGGVGQTTVIDPTTRTARNLERELVSAWTQRYCCSRLDCTLIALVIEAAMDMPSGAMDPDLIRRHFDDSNRKSKKSNRKNQSKTG